MTVWSGAVATLTGFGALMFAMNALIGRLIEFRYPLHKNQPPRDVIFDILYAVFVRAISPLLSAIAGPVSIYAMGRLGSGWFDLGLLPFPIALLSYLLAEDFLEYWLHRAYHAFPFMWAIHSFHHSDESFNNFTGWRHVWLCGIIYRIGISLPLAIIFHVPLSVLLAFAVIQLAVGSLMHLNSPMEFGRFSLWFINPQFHRIHHSVQAEHRDKNFANALPLWDVVFRTAWTPRKGEFPDTGLVPRELPDGFVDALVWPWRQSLRRLVPSRRFWKPKAQPVYDEPAA